MTHRGPFQPLPFCDSVVPTTINLNTSFKNILNNLLCYFKFTKKIIQSFISYLEIRHITSESLLFLLNSSLNSAHFKIGNILFETSLRQTEHFLPMFSQ